MDEFGIIARHFAPLAGAGAFALTDDAGVIPARPGFDLVVTTDTCIAHLAGAMGKPVWILLPHLADWRWMQDIPYTPWYPTARLLRQKSPGDWQELIDRVGAELNFAHPLPS